MTIKLIVLWLFVGSVSKTRLCLRTYKKTNEIGTCKFQNDILNMKNGL